MKETVIQFGEGNFLRGFADYFIHRLNEKGLYDGKAVIVQPISRGTADLLNKQNCVYNLFLRGIENGKEICEHTEIHSVSRAVNPYSDFSSFLQLAHNPDFRFVISNTTEAGIAFDPSCKFEDAPPSSFPAKLTVLLYERFKAGLSGFVMLSCELIDNNGAELQKCVTEYARLWELGDDFLQWIINKNKFCNTLVDRIVTGYPREEAESLGKIIGYDDKLLDSAEKFHLWVIEGNFENELPLQKAGLNVIWTEDVKPYKKRKVRVLNGAHTSAVFPAMLCGIKTVKEALDDEQLKRFINTCLFDYILPVLGDNEDNRRFAGAVLERFANPYIKHMWSSISLNSISKYKARVLPTVKDFIATNSYVPRPLAFSLACLIEYYKNNDINDDATAVEFIKANDIKAILCNGDLWGEDISAMCAAVTECTEKLHLSGIRGGLEWAMS